MSKTNEKSSIDNIIDLYKKDVDMSLIEENLKLTHQQRLDKLIQVVRFLEEVKKKGQDV